MAPNPTAAPPAALSPLSWPTPTVLGGIPFGQLADKDTSPTIPTMPPDRILSGFPTNYHSLSLSHNLYNFFYLFLPSCNLSPFPKPGAPNSNAQRGEAGDLNVLPRPLGLPFPTFDIDTGPKCFSSIFFKLIDKLPLRLSLSVRRKKGLVRSVTNCKTHTLPKWGSCLILSARWVCQESGTKGTISYQFFSVETGKSDFYVKSHNFKFGLKFAKALCQLKTRGMYRQQWAYRHQFGTSAPWYHEFLEGTELVLLICVYTESRSTTSP